MPVNYISDGYTSVTPSLIVDGASALIEFLSGAFGATERFRMPTADGKVAHAEIDIGGSVVMLGDATEQFPAGQGFVHLYVPDVDGAYRRALDLGATTIMPPEDQFYGDRSANITDPWGNRWTISTHIEDVSEEEMARRMAALG